MKLDFPDKLHPEAKKFGEEILKELERQNVVQELDINLLNLAVMSYHTFVVTRDDVLQNGPTYKTDGFIKLNPAVQIMKDQQVQLFKVFDQLGMSPKSRKMLDSLPPSMLDTESPLKNFMKNVETRN